MSDWGLSEKDLLAIKRQAEKQEKARLRKIRHDVRLAVATNTGVSYDLRTLIDAGIGAGTIRKLFRSEGYR